jgi:uncharacterized protein (TIGR02300 family)
MATKADRGTKRTCQDASCAVRFYDLAREPITCPTCGAVYQIVMSPPAAERRPGRKVPIVAPAAPEPIAEDALPIEASDEAIEAPGDETLPEADEDNTDPADFVGEPEKDER